LLLWLQRVLIGYGYYNFLVLGWVLGFCVLDVLVLQWSDQGPAQKMPYGISYSVDMLLPIINLNEQHDAVTSHLTGWVQWYFYVHQIVGYILASFLVVGLTGLTKKNE
jgi:uncharacterized membrane protein (DUF106 family)